MAGSTLRLSVDLIGSKKLASQAGGHAEIQSRCSEMKSFLETAFSNRSVRAKQLPAQGDDIAFEFDTDDPHHHADLIVAAVKSAFLDCRVGRKFRYVVYAV